MIKNFRLCLGCVLLPMVFCGTVRSQEEAGFEKLFNGKDLTGWDGNPALWTVEDGSIIGRNKGSGHLKYNEFLIWRGGQPANFELKAVIRVIGGNNSGIQYRSQERPEVGKWVIAGYQCDVHSNPLYTAMAYQERGRSIIGHNGQDVITDPAGIRWLVAERDPVKVDISHFQEYKIVAQGNHLSHFINGQIAASLVDYDEKNRSLSGLIAIQLHSGNAMEVQVKSIQLKVLPDGGVTPFEKSNIPSDAQAIEAKRPVPAPAPGAAAPAPAPQAAKPAAAAEKGKGKGTPKNNRQAQVGPRVGENKATPVDLIKAPEGFAVELIYSVPGIDRGSWVALCHDDKGRIYASDQYGALYSFDPPAPGKGLSDADVRKEPVEIRAINGMVYAFGAIYAGVNDYEQKLQSGLYKITDSDGDGQLDKADLLRAFDSKSDHGVHAVLPTADGKNLYLVTGNNAVLTDIEPTSPVQKIWCDDHLLPRMPDGRGHNRHVLAPGGIIYKVSPDGKKFEAIASGFRNIYDASLNKDGELFTYDADMEYDFNTPWYRPTRVNHVVSGAEFGWRNGAGKYPEFYVDNLPATVNIGPGSPTGTCFGYGAKFPAKYQEALYLLDWSWGKIYAVHLREDGASYVGEKQDFISGAPLPVTDAIIHPRDGAMYFAIGGRRVQSGLYRVTYQGRESTAPIDLKPQESEARQLRHSLEAFHGKKDVTAIAAAWPHLSHPDRFIRWAARVALEHQPVEEWKERAFSESDPAKKIEAILALTRVSGKCPSQTETQVPVDAELRDRMLSALFAIDWKALSPERHLALVRLTEVILHRFGDPSDPLKQKIANQLDAHFPADSFELNWLLCETLAYLQHPATAKKAMALIASAASQEPEMEFARSLRFLKTGWTPQLRKEQLEWFLKAANYRGGASFTKFIEFIRNDSLDTFTEAEKKTHAELIARKAEQKSAIESAGAIFAGRTPTMWTLEELSEAAKTGLVNRDFESGRRMFSASACYACHRFGNAGGMNGPDLTGAGGRYNPHDLLDSIINPSKEINEQFAPIVVTKKDGSMISGVVVNLSGDNVMLNTDLSDPDQRATIDRKEVVKIEVSKISPMPPNLLAMLKKEEILDLLAYILSGGDRQHAMFAKQPEKSAQAPGVPVPIMKPAGEKEKKGNAPTARNSFHLLPIWNRLMLGTTSEDTIRREMDRLIEQIGKGNDYHRVGFSFIYPPGSPDIVERNCRIASQKGLVLGLILGMQTHGNPRFQSRFLDDLRNYQWQSDGQTWRNLKEPLKGLSWRENLVPLTPSRYSEAVRRETEKEVRRQSREILAIMEQYPGVIAVINPLVEQGLGGSEDENGNYVYNDAGPYTTTEFRDWLRHAGLYDRDHGPYAGQGAPEAIVGKYPEISGQPRSCYYDDPSPAEGIGNPSFNQTFGTTFKTWDLRWWDLEEFSSPIPHHTTNWQPGEGEKGNRPGGFHIPLKPDPTSRFWRAWCWANQDNDGRYPEGNPKNPAFGFSQVINRNYVNDVIGWMIEEGLPSDRLYAHQLPTEALGNDPVAVMQARTMGMTAWTGYLPACETVGIHYFGTVDPKVANQYAKNWGIFEWHPLPGARPHDSRLYEIALRDLGTYSKEGCRFLFPGWWHLADEPITHDGIFPLPDSRFAVAIRDFLEKLPNQPLE